MKGGTQKFVACISLALEEGDSLKRQVAANTVEMLFKNATKLYSR
jgi:hypothetical protein